MSRLFAVLAAALLIAACSKSAEDQLLGIWYEVDGSETMEFFDDGTVTIDSLVDFSGEYQILEDGQLRFDLDGLGELVGPIVFSYEVDDDSLEIVTPDGERSTYSREAG